MNRVIPLCLFLLANLFTSCAKQPYNFSGSTSETYPKPASQTLFRASASASWPEIITTQIAPAATKSQVNAIRKKSIIQIPTPVAAAHFAQTGAKIPAVIVHKSIIPLPGMFPKARPNRRNKTVAAILAAPPLGMLGLHRFYLGYYLVGVLQLGLTLVGIFMGPPPLIILAFCWIITDFVRILKEVLEPKDGRYK